MVIRIRACSRSEYQLREDAESARETSDDMNAVLIDGWVGVSADRLLRGPFLSKSGFQGSFGG